MDASLIGPIADKSIALALLIIAVVWLVRRDDKRQNRADALVRGVQKDFELKLTASEAHCREELGKERSARESLEKDFRMILMGKLDTVNMALVTVGEGFGDIKARLKLITREMNIEDDPARRTAAQINAIKG